MKKQIVIQGKSLNFIEKIIDIVNNNPEHFEIFGIISDYLSSELEIRIKRHNPEFVCILSLEDAGFLKINIPELKVYTGKEGLETALRLSNSVAIIEEKDTIEVDDEELKNYMLNTKSRIQSLAS